MSDNSDLCKGKPYIYCDLFGGCIYKVEKDNIPKDCSHWCQKYNIGL